MHNLDHTRPVSLPTTAIEADASTLTALCHSSLDPVFRLVEHLDHISAWSGHIPFAQWVIRATEPRLLVELGTHTGVSYAAFCQAVEAEKLNTRCFAVDTWQGDEHAGRYDEEVFANLQRFHDQRFGTFSHLLRCTFDEALDKFAAGSVDLLHIDGMHTFEAVRHDLESWFPKLSDRAVILFHDTNERQRDFGVWKLWAELEQRYPAFEFLHSHGLGVLCAGREAPAPVLDLCLRSASDSRLSALIRARFAWLGERWESEARSLRLERSLALQDDRIQAVTEAHHAEIQKLTADWQARHSEALETARTTEVALRTEVERLARVQGLEVSRCEKIAAGAARAAEVLRLEIAALEKAARSSRPTGEPDTVQAAVTAALALVDQEAAARETAEARAEQALQERDALLASTAWKVTWPLRQAGGYVPPPVRRHGRRALKGLWRATTPWMTSRRLQAAREHALAEVRLDAEQRTKPSPASVPTDPLPAATPPHVGAYAKWIAEIEPAGHLPTLEGAARSFGETRFSFLIAVLDRPSALAATLRSLAEQSNLDWEALVAVPEGATAETLWGVAGSAAFADRRIQLVPCPDVAVPDRGALLQKLLSAASGAYFAVLDPGDVLPPRALDEVAHALAHNPDTVIAYSDEDEISSEGLRENPCFKPSWSPELLYSYNYFGRLAWMERDLALQIGGFAPGTGTAAEWDLNLRATEAVSAAPAERRLRITRIARVLCHRAPGSDRERPSPASSSAREHRNVLREFWIRRGIENPRVETQPNGTQRSSWELPSTPLVSVIIPNRNSPRLLRRCLAGLLDQTDYRSFEIIVVDNQSEDPELLELYEELRQRPNFRLVAFDRPFNYSAACNRGAAQASGALLLFLNNDIEVTDSGWLSELVRFATRPGVGVVGTKLRYPTGELQHAGVIVGIHLYGLMYRHAREGGWDVFGSPDHPRNWLAIMGACQMVRREVFDAVGGFDETYRIANSDIALCLRAYRAGWRIAYTPFAELTHHEGASRGRSNPIADMIRSAAEVRRLGFDDDPYFHPGLSAVDPIPRLRAADEPGTRENLAREIDRLLATAPQPETSLDLFDDWDVLSATGLPREFALLPAQSPFSVGDRWSLARWIINLLRMRPDLRARFPTALSAGPNGAFATWLRAEGGKQFGLPPNSGEHLERLFADDPATRARQVYFWRDDLRAAFPLGLLPPGRRGLAAWMLRRGRIESDLRPEEIWWFLLSCAEDPAIELVRTYLFTPAWQQAHPCGLTIFGNASFAAWLAEQYSIPLDFSGWLNPASWPMEFGPAEQVRLAYVAREEWRAAHPHALEDEQCAQALLEWLPAPEAGLPATARDWCAARALDGTATALVTVGANVLGHFCYPSGLRASVEAMSTALEAAGCPVCRRDMRTEQTDDPHHTDYRGLEIHDITIIHAQPEPFFVDAYRRADLTERTPRTYRIAYWYWELDKVPSWWAEKARAVDEIWAATNFITDALRRTGAAPVRTMFPGVQIPSFTRRPREALGLAGTEGRFVFLFSFHMASIMERKNPLAVIQSFKQAFRSDEPVELVIKTTSSNRHAAQMAELQAAAADARITIMDRVLAPDETLSLMDSCDAYVSLHRSEGLGLTMAEAMLLGKPVIATRYSGNLDFMDDENSLLVDYKLIQLDRPVPPYDASAHWADPSVDHAARLMRRVYENPDWAAELGAKAQSDARIRLSVEAAGQRMAARLAEIKERRHGGEPRWSRWRGRC